MSAAESESTVYMNGCSERQKEKGPAGCLSPGVKPRNVNAIDVPPRFPV